MSKRIDTFYQGKGSRDATAFAYAVSEAADQLCSAFVFSDTREGHQYWWNVYKRLREIARIYRAQASKPPVHAWGAGEIP